MPAVNIKDSRRAEKRRLAADKAMHDRTLIFGDPTGPQGDPLDLSVADVQNGWICDVAEAAGLVFDGLVYWGQGATRRQTGIKYLDYSRDQRHGHLVVFYLSGHVWSDRHGAFKPNVADYSPDADIPCFTLRQACVLNFEFEKEGFRA